MEAQIEFANVPVINLERDVKGFIWLYVNQKLTSAPWYYPDVKNAKVKLI